MGLAQKEQCPIRRFAFCLSWAAVVTFLVTLSLPSRCDAQVLYGSIVGNVTDPTGSAVPGATVTIINKETNQTRQATTDARGAYSFLDVRGGTYTVKVSLPGFKTHEKSGVTVTLNAVTRVDVTLEVGSITQSVTVSAEVEVLQTDTAEVHANVGRTEVENLPVPLGRNYQQIFRSLPGFAPPQNQHSIPTNPSRALSFNVNGVSRNQNNTRIDGVSTYNIQLPHVNSYVPTLESIQEVNVVTNSFDAEQGFAAGAAINVETRSGTNSFHGSLFEHHSNQHIKAWPMRFNNAGLNVGNKPKFIDNSFGGTAGGPIVKDKLFFFASYEGLYQRQTAERFQNAIPTAAMRVGDLRSSTVAVYDPLTGDQVTGFGRTQFVASSDPSDPNYNPACADVAGCPNVIPTNRLDPIAQNILSFVPLPNLPGDFDNFFVNAPFKWNRNQVDTKINYLASEKLNFIGTFGFLRYSDVAPTIFGDAAIGRLIGAGGNPGMGSGDTYRTTIMGTYTFTPTFVMDAHFGYSRQGTNSEQQRLGENIGRDLLGIPGTNGTREFESSWPQFDLDGFEDIGITFNFMPYFRKDPQYQYVANFNWIKGDHNIRFGGDIYRQGLNHTQAEFLGEAFGAQGGFGFGRGVTQTCLALSATDPTKCATTSGNSRNNSIATFLIGLPHRRGRTLQVPDSYHIRAMLYSFYVRDRWNITPKLTANFGVRWEYIPPPTRLDRGIESYDFNTNEILLCGTASIPEDCGVEVSKKHFTPRIGFAYRATDTLVFRAGYGISTDPFEWLEGLRANYPVQAAVNETDDRGSLFPVGTLAEGIPDIPVPDATSGRVVLPGNVNYGGWPQKFQRGYVQSWNFFVQKQLGAKFTGQVGYVGTRSIRQLAILDFNAGQILGAAKDGQPLFQQFGRDAQNLMVFPVGTGHYDSLQATLQRRFSGGLALTVNYTWSKAIGNVENATTRPEIRVFEFLDLNRSRTPFDRAHNMSITNVWALPFGRGKRWASNNAVGSALLGGWQLNSLVSLISGRPFTVTGSQSGFNTPGSTRTADQVKAEVQKLGGIGQGEPYYDREAFAQVNEVRFGTAGFNILEGPGIVNWDFGVFREFSITERYKLQFRMESFNFSNTPHFDVPGNDQRNVSNSNFMYITGVTNLSREGIDERQFRFGLRLSF